MTINSSLEKLTVLYVIGNGFDLHHDIPSSLENFKAYIKSKDLNIFYDIEEYVPANNDWSDLEESLGDVDSGSIFEHGENFLESYGSDDWSDDNHHSMQFEVERLCGHLSSDLTSLLEDWIASLSSPSNPRILLHRNSIFLNFNYTDTLEETYGIESKKVLHPHGYIKNRPPNLVLGHAWTPDKNLVDYADEETDHRVYESYQLIDSYFKNSFKPTENIIQDNTSFFEKLGEVSKVFVLGHALHEVDQPYLEKITEFVRDDAKFIISYYNDLEDIIQKSTIFGNNVEFITLTELEHSRS